MFFFTVLDSNFPINLFSFLDYRCSNSNDRASQGVTCYVMTNLSIYISAYIQSPTFGPTGSGPRMTPVKSKLDQTKVQWSK